MTARAVGEHRTRRAGEVFFITAPVEHCAGHGVEKIPSDYTNTSAVQRLRLRCCGCGRTLVFTATLRVEAGTSAQLELA